MQCNVSGHEMKITFDKKGSSTLLAPLKHWHFFFPLYVWLLSHIHK